MNGISVSQYFIEAHLLRTAPEGYFCLEEVDF